MKTKIILTEDYMMKAHDELIEYWKKEWDERIVPAYLKSIENDTCHYCGIAVYDISTHLQYTGIQIPYRQEKTTDHVIPKSKGGSNDPANLVIACRNCNTRKGNRLYFIA